MEKHGVQLVLSGHEHAFERTHSLQADAVVQSGTGTAYVIQRQGGADLEAVGALPQTAVSMQVHNYSRVDVNGGQLYPERHGRERQHVRSNCPESPAHCPSRRHRLQRQLFRGLVSCRFSRASIWRSKRPPPRVPSMPTALNGVSVRKCLASWRNCFTFHRRRSTVSRPTA